MAAERRGRRSGAIVGEGTITWRALAVSFPQLKSEPSVGSPLDALSTKCLEECSEGDISSPASTGMQVKPGDSNDALTHITNTHLV